MGHVWTFSKTSLVEASQREVFSWHEQPGALERLTPPWESVRLASKSGVGVQNGTRVTLELKIGPFVKQWIAEHSGYTPYKSFKDTQISGPFKSWAHQHIFEQIGLNQSRMSDEVSYSIPLSPVSDFFCGAFLQRKLMQMFSYRHSVVRQDLAFLKSLPQSNLRILVSGGTGLVGQALIPLLLTAGHSVTMLSRSSGPGKIVWDPDRGRFPELQELEGFDAVVHLAGENIAARRLTAARKAKILNSREQTTLFLTDALSRCTDKPKVFICASAVGFYGSRGDELLDETAEPGHDFLSQVCKVWERSTRQASQAGIRVVNLRFGAILSPRGGALGKMLPAFRLGLGASLASGQQFMSWISIDDAVRAILFAIVRDELVGPINVVSPNPETNLTFTRTLAKVLNRSSFFAIPPAVLRLLFGEIADLALLSSTRAHPSRLLSAGFQFAHPHLEDALRNILGKQIFRKEEIAEHFSSGNQQLIPL